MAHSNHNELSPQPTQRETRRNFPQDLFTTDVKSKRPPTVTISKPLAEVFAFFRNFSNHTKFMKDVTSVADNGSGHCHWVLNHEGKVTEWNTEVVREIPDELVAWRSLENSDIKFVGAATFEKAPGDRGTIVSLKIENEAFFAVLTEALAKFVGQDCDTQAYSNLRRLKAYMETGEVPTIEGQPNGVDKEELPARDLNPTHLH